MTDKTKNTKERINKTHLPIGIAEERQIIHRDYIAHCLRWSHTIRNSKVGETVLDLGCADAPLGMAYYTNKYKPKAYVGVDIRKSILEKAAKNLEKAKFKKEFICCNMITEFNKIPKKKYSIITSFEMIEHIEGHHVEPLLKNIKDLMGPKTMFFLSTPCYDGKHQAGNHVKEWYYQELKDLLQKHFRIEEHYGTFMSQKDLKRALKDNQPYADLAMELFGPLHDYYDSNMLSVIYAPLFPAYSRNCIWKLRKC